MVHRRSSDELRQLLLDAGLRVLYRQGLRATASHVQMTEATAELASTHGIKVGMGSIFGPHRLWPDVRTYQLDLLEAAINDTSGGGPNDSSLALIHEFLSDMRGEPYSSRAAMMTELCRIAGTLNGYVKPRDPKGRSWDLWVGIWATAMTADDAGDRLVPALREEVSRTNRSFVSVYKVMLDKLALRIREPYTIEHLALLAGAMTDGIALRSAVDPDSTGPIQGLAHDREWNLLGVGLAAIAHEIIADAESY